MSILINKHTKVITQGMTGATGSFHTQAALDYCLPRKKTEMRKAFTWHLQMSHTKARPVCCSEAMARPRARFQHLRA